MSFAELEERKTAALPPSPDCPARQRKAERAGPPLPPWLDADLWAAWRAERKARRKPLTDRAEALQVRELERLREQGQDPRAVVEQSIARGWTGLFPVHKDQPRLPPRAPEDDRPRPPPIEELRARRAAQTQNATPAGPEGLGDVLKRLTP